MRVFLAGSESRSWILESYLAGGNGKGRIIEDEYLFGRKRTLDVGSRANNERERKRERENINCKQYLKKNGRAWSKDAGLLGRRDIGKQQALMERGTWTYIWRDNTHATGGGKHLKLLEKLI